RKTWLRRVRHRISKVICFAPTVSRDSMVGENPNFSSGWRRSQGGSRLAKDLSWHYRDGGARTVRNLPLKLWESTVTHSHILPLALWRGAAQAWNLLNGSQTTPMELGPHLEKFRAFLAGQIEFPRETTSVMVLVCS